MLGVKANRSALEYSSSKADELKVEFSAEWLRIWRYEGVLGLQNSPRTTHSSIDNTLMDMIIKNALGFGIGEYR